MLGVAVTPASVQDRDQIAPLLKEVRRLFPFLERAIADSGYQGATTAAVVKKAARLPLEIVKRSDTAKGFVVLPKRWIVERTFGWLGRCRRLAKDFENLARSHLAFVHLAMIRLMLRRIARNRADFIKSPDKPQRRLWVSGYSATALQHIVQTPSVATHEHLVAAFADGGKDGHQQNHHPGGEQPGAHRALEEDQKLPREIARARRRFSSSNRPST